MNLKQAIKLAILFISTEVYFLFLFFSQPKTSNLVSPKYILQTRKTVKIKTSNP